MSEEDHKLLQAVREWRPPTKLHPMAMRAWHLYNDHKNALPREALETLRSELDAFGDDLKGLAESLEGLSRFMILVTENYQDRTTGAQVVELMRSYTHRFEPFWERVGEALNNVGAEAQSTFGTFMARDTSGEKSAPAFGQPAPKDTVPLRNLAPPPRPPTWSTKKSGTPR